MSLKKLKKTYAGKGIVLAIGAGVSTGAGLPDWRKLLQGIGLVCLGKKGDEVVGALINEGFSLPSIAGMLRASCPKRKKFSDIVRAKLYEEFPFYPQGVGANNSEAMIDYVRKSEKQVLNGVASLCAVPDNRYTGQKFFVRNPRVYAIINFNIDAVLREYVEVSYPRVDKHPIVRTVERASKSSDPEKISIYHMHGFLRFDPKANRPDKEAFDKLVFAEQEYFDYFNSPTSLFNYTFLYLLREYSCLFIGLSMKDDNIRRLLHYSRKERAQAFEEEKKKRQNKIETKVLRHFAILKRLKSRARNQLVERSLNYLGTMVLWVDKYEDIPDLLGNLYESGGDKWSAVYQDLSAAHLQDT